MKQRRSWNIVRKGRLLRRHGEAGSSREVSSREKGNLVLPLNGVLLACPARPCQTARLRILVPAAPRQATRLTGYTALRQQKWCGAGGVYNAGHRPEYRRCRPFFWHPIRSSTVSRYSMQSGQRGFFLRPTCRLLSPIKCTEQIRNIERRYYAAILSVPPQRYHCD